jgi:pyrimidine-nucleoside phosphorylase
MSAMLMAIYFNGMNEDETFSLVNVMLNSGTILKFPQSNSYIGDKHSTGGVGDKVSLILAPIVAAAGIKIPMIAGRGLGFTGGTIDKLESIPGFDVSPDLDIFKQWVEKSGYAIMSQSNEICPADKKIYDLRSKTGTVSSIPLICGSIMSKKIAEGISGLALDIKIGNGTFMKTKEEAIELGSWMKKIGKAFNIKTDLTYTNMDQPLGRFAGLSCEVKEAIECLKGNGPDDLMAVTLELGSKLLLQSGAATSRSDAIDLQTEIINTGRGLKSFENSVETQGGRLDKFDSENKPKHEAFIYPEKPGIITNMNTESIGWSLVELGCVMKNNNDTLDHTAGMEFLRKTGDEVEHNEPICRIFCSNEKKLDTVSRSLSSAIIIGEDHHGNNPIIY